MTWNRLTRHVLCILEKAGKCYTEVNNHDNHLLLDVARQRINYSVTTDFFFPKV